MKLHIAALFIFCTTFFNSFYACNAHFFNNLHEKDKKLRLKRAINQTNIPYLTELFHAQLIGPNTNFTIKNLLSYNNVSPEILKLYAQYISIHDYRHFVLCNDFNKLAPLFTRAIIEKFGIIDLPEFNIKDQNVLFAAVVPNLRPIRNSADCVFAYNMMQHIKKTTLFGGIKIEKVQRFKETYEFIQSWMRRCIKTFLLCVSKTNPQYMITGYPEIISNYHAAFRDWNTYYFTEQ